MPALFKQILEHIELTESRATDAICNNPEQLQSLARGAIDSMSTDGESILDLPLAIVKQRIRSYVDGQLINRDVRLNASGLEAVTDCVLQHIRTNLDQYQLT